MDPEERTCARCTHSKSLHYHAETFCFADVDGANCGCPSYVMGSTVELAERILDSQR